jgi:acetoin utilization deacetylase AcuC-like enzyme
VLEKTSDSNIPSTDKPLTSAVVDPEASARRGRACHEGHRTGFITHPSFVDHITGPGHPERPDRIRAINTAVRAAGLIDSPNPFCKLDYDFGSFPPNPQKLVELPAPVAADERWLATVHTAGHIENIRRVCAGGAAILDDGDTPVCGESFDVALLAVGAVLAACDAVMEKHVDRVFCAVRPPGHHAEPDRPMGFCLFTNVAIAARYLQEHHKIKRVAIVDFDVHHGNGTQEAFIDDPSVLFISMHQDPRTCYPGTGYASETGTGAGQGYTMNIPFAAGCDGPDYLQKIKEEVLPALDRFQPEVLLLSAGFDAHREDPLAQINLVEQDFYEITRLLAERADKLCQGRVISVLEGGYNLVALGRSVVYHLQALTELT